LKFDVYRNDELDHSIEIKDFSNYKINELLELLQKYNKNKIAFAKKEGEVIKIKTGGFYIKINSYFYEVYDIYFVGDIMGFVGPKGEVGFEIESILEVDLEPM
jgi:hypothetical protein